MDSLKTRTLLTQEDYIAAEASALYVVVQELLEEGWQHQAQLVRRDRVLVINFTDFSPAGELGRFPFWRLIEGSVGSKISTILCNVHGMGDDQRRDYTFNESYS